jgi:hypothetical protein
MKKRILALLTTVVAALVVCSTALANSLTCGHGGTCGPSDNAGGVFASQHIGRSGSSGGGGTLPYTGLNLATVAVLAMLLIAAGLTLRWATGRRS